MQPNNVEKCNHSGFTKFYKESRDGPVSTVTRLRAGYRRILDSNLDKTKIFFSYPSFQTDSGSHVASYLMDTGVL
jgi:hypothetical protein